MGGVVVPPETAWNGRFAFQRQEAFDQLPAFPPLCDGVFLSVHRQYFFIQRIFFAAKLGPVKLHLLKERNVPAQRGDFQRHVDPVSVDGVIRDPRARPFVRVMVALPFRDLRRLPGRLLGDQVLLLQNALHVLPAFGQCEGQDEDQRRGQHQAQRYFLFHFLLLYFAVDDPFCQPGIALQARKPMVRRFLKAFCFLRIGFGHGSSLPSRASRNFSRALCSLSDTEEWRMPSACAISFTFIP